jgi:hypothetical protein
MHILLTFKHLRLQAICFSLRVGEVLQKIFKHYVEARSTQSLSAHILVLLIYIEPLVCVSF